MDYRKIMPMREAVAGVYPGIGWKARVARMPTNQIIAIYNKFLMDGRFEKRKEIGGYKQLTLFDFGLKEVK